MQLHAVHTPSRRVAIAMIAMSLAVVAVIAYRVTTRTQAEPVVWCRIPAVPAIQVAPAPPARW